MHPLQIAAPSCPGDRRVDSFLPFPLCLSRFQPPVDGKNNADDDNGCYARPNHSRFRYCNGFFKLWCHMTSCLSAPDFADFFIAIMPWAEAAMFLGPLLALIVFHWVLQPLHRWIAE